MCGRIAVYFDSNEVKEMFEIDRIVRGFTPGYNIAPGWDIPVIVAGSRLLDAYKWGMIPGWAQHMDKHKGMINARAESLLEKRSFKKPFLEFRCIILVSGFYEWGNKIPHYISLKDKKPMALAGIASFFKNQNGEKIGTCCIITTEANSLISNFHHRMPVIIKEKDIDFWLAPENKDDDMLMSLLIPYDSTKMQEHIVSSKVNTPKYNYPDVINPINKSQYSITS